MKVNTIKMINMKKSIGQMFFRYNESKSFLSEYPFKSCMQLMFVIQLFQFTTAISDIWCNRSIQNLET